MKRIYYQLIDCSDPNYEAGEIVGVCAASDLRQAKRRLGIHPQNEALYAVVPASRLADNVYDPCSLRSVQIH